MNIKEYIDTHKEQINYCEIIIYPDGTLEDAIPSHVEKLINITGEDREAICYKMPMQAAPVPWLVDYTNCCSIWYDMGMIPENFTEEQKNTIKMLKEVGQLSKNFQYMQLHEMKICSSNIEEMKVIQDEEDLCI